ncbi:MAG: hypothetical protein JO121_30390 [Deltaproteobacteria bacterium]|nr:hypothetical protein [Deltaproteobacteria bacterium]
MPIQAAPINLLTFLQGWTSSAVALPPQRLLFSVLVLPKGNPLTDFAPAFPTANLQFQAGVIASLDALPTAAAATWVPVTANATPPNRPALFSSVAARFTVRPHGGAPSPTPAAVKKWLPDSYRTATALARPRTSIAITDDSYQCAIRDPGAIPVPKSPPAADFYWEEILGFVLRQPLLAQQMGLIYTGYFDLPVADTLASGGYVYIDLTGASDYAAVKRTRFAARVPPLAKARLLFTPVLFPVDQVGDFDNVFEEADAYDDGFAKVVHGAQPTKAALLETSASSMPPAKDMGIRLGWDDEQIAIWLNRQLGVNAYSSVTPAPGSPLGVAGYRVDVFSDADNRWHSLVRARGSLSLNGTDIGSFDGELNVEALPVNLTNNQGAQFWLPSYFTAWAGGSLVVTDPNPFELAGRADVLGAPIYTAVDADAVKLRYGNDYQFRVRLADLTGGGPTASDDPLYPARANVATVPFRRYSRPKAVSAAKGGGVAADGKTASYTVSRPLLPYPDIMFTGYPNALALLTAEAAAAKAAGREPALPDPNAVQLQIQVQARTLDNDTAAGTTTGQPFVPVYSVVVDFPADPAQPLPLNFQFVDVANIASLAGTVAAPNSPLPLPTSRNVRLVLTPLGAEDPELKYWGSLDSRIGSAPVSLYLSVPAGDETGLLLPPAVGAEIEALFLQPDPPPNTATKAALTVQGFRHQAESSVMDRLASELRLSYTDARLSSPSGRRTVFGASSGLRTTANPDSSSITFGSTSDLIRHWIVAIRATINRDWTWNGLAPTGLEIYRDGVLTGRLPLPRAVNPGALVNPDRSQTDIVYFDSIEPKPLGSAFPAELKIDYRLVSIFANAPAISGGPSQWTLRLPITTPPAQTPKIVSAGIAYSPYTHAPAYSSSGERRRILYFELDGPPLDPSDAYFCRVLAYGPDPMLLETGTKLPDPAEPPLPIDPELVRTVAPGQSADCAGIEAMQNLVASPTSDRHYLVPLPDYLNPESVELFGFFVYELRVGHDCSRWSTAQARFGRPLRVAGVQHPAPQLRCMVTRTAAKGITVVAPYATPIFNDQNLRPLYPKTELIALLYAQVLQANSQSWCNILLERATAIPYTLEHQGSRGLNPALTPARAQFDPEDILFKLGILGLPLDSPLSVVAVEILPEPQPINPAATVDRFNDPLGADLGQVRILRTSPLTPVPEVCPPAG